MNRVRCLATLFCCFALALGIAGCVDKAEDRGDIIRVGNGTEPEGLDPHIITGEPEHQVLTSLFEGLARMDPTDLSIIPGVAERWEVSEDRLVYTFYLRHDAKWSNGDPVTAHDFAYAWRRMLTPSLAAEYSYMLHPMRNAAAYNAGTLTDFSEVGCEVIDDHTLRVTLDYPTPYFLSLHSHYSWFPVHQATIEKFGRMDDRASKWTRAGNLVSNGPYVLTRWTPNAVIEVRPNEHYWDRKGVLNDGIDFFPINSEQTEERMFRAGELHVTKEIPEHKVPEYQENRPEVLRIDPWIGTYFYRVNTTRTPLNDVRVRKALAMSIDRVAICTRVMRSGRTPAYYLTPPDLAGYTSETSLRYDVEEAKRLLADAGYPNGKGFPTVDILYNTMEQHQLIAEAIQQMWKKTLGIHVTLTNQEWKVYLDSTSNDRLDFDLARAGWVGDVVDAMNFLECFISGNGNNRTGWGNPEYDRALAEAIRKSDTAERHALYQKAEAILVEEMPIIPIYHYTRAYLIDPRLHGFDSNLLSYRAYHKLWLDKGTQGE